MNGLNKKIENVIIIGGGAAGLSAGIYLARAGLKPLIFAGSPPGGQLILTSEVENYPGHDSILGGQLIENMRNQVKKFGGVIRDENVTKVELVKPVKLVESIHTKSIIVATGAKALWLGLESEKRLRGKGVSACATCDGFFFKNKVAAVIGGGDSALEEALTLTKFASKVYIIHRRDSFRASKVMQQRVFENKKIEVVWNTRVLDVLGEKKVEGIKLETCLADSAPVLLPASARKLRAIGDPSARATCQTRKILVEGVFVAVGHKPDMELFKGIIERDDKGYILTFNRLAESVLRGKIVLSPEKKDYIASTDIHYGSSTNIEGVFAAGDCVDSVYRQASTAAGMGVAAALDVERWLERGTNE